MSPIRDGDQIALGFDGSKGGISQIPDTTGLVGCRLSDGLLFVLGAWSPPETGWDTWKPDRKTITATVLATHKRYRVERAHGDPPGWETEIETWQRRTMIRRRGKKQLEPVWFPFETYRPKQMGVAIERFETAVRSVEIGDDGTFDGDICHDGDPQLATHIANTRTTTDRSWTKLTKPDQASKIDLAVCAVLAYDARCLAIADGLLDEKRRTGRAVFI